MQAGFFYSVPQMYRVNRQSGVADFPSSKHASLMVVQNYPVGSEF